MHGDGTSPGDQVPGIGSGTDCGRTERFDGGAHLDMHHTKPAAVFQGSQSIRLGDQSSRGVRNRCVVRPTSAQYDTLRPLEDCSAASFVWCISRWGPPSNRLVRPQYLTRFQRLDFHGVHCSIVRRKKERLKFPTKSQWKTFGKINDLWTTDDQLPYQPRWPLRGFWAGIMIPNITLVSSGEKSDS